jgi:hypothetical protein
MTAMALHPQPNSEILLPYMHPNLAEISRAWVANTILSQQVHLPHMPMPTNINSHHYQQSPTQPSNPHEVLNWTFPSMEHLNTLPTKDSALHHTHCKTRLTP